MSGRVPTFPSRIDSSDSVNRLRNAAPVYATDHRDMGRLANWLLGRGCTLVSAPGCNTVIPDGSSAVYRYYIWPHLQNHVRLWYVGIESNTGPVFGTIAIGSAVRQWSIQADHTPYQPKVFEVWQTVDPPSGTAGEVTVTIEHNAASHDTANVRVSSISCFELPRVNLEDFGPLIPDLDSLAAGRLIYQDLTSTKSISAVSLAMESAKTHARRPCLFSNFNPDGFTTTSLSYVTAFGGPVLPRKMHVEDTQRTIAWAAYVLGTGGGAAGSVRLTAGSGATDTEAFTGAAQWVTGSVAVNCEDPSRLEIDGGLPGGVRETVVAEVLRTTATNVTIYGLCAGETF